MAAPKCPSLSEVIAKSGTAPTAGRAAVISTLHAHQDEVQSRYNHINSVVMAAMLSADDPTPVKASVAKKAKAKKPAETPAPETV